MANNAVLNANLSMLLTQMYEVFRNKNHGTVGVYMPENHGKPDMLAKLFNLEVTREKQALLVNSRGAETAADIITSTVYHPALYFGPMRGTQQPVAANESHWRMVI